MKRKIYPPIGNSLSCKNWQIEAAYRMIQNNLHPDVAEFPEDLIVYGGKGKAARDWKSFDSILETLKRLQPDETLLIQSGKPVGVAKTHIYSPRILIANSNLVPKWATWEHFDKLEKDGLMMYGQMTAGSWIYIGTQGILQGTYETFVSAAKKHWNQSNLNGKLVLTAGLGGMGGAQPLAVKMAGGAIICIEIDPNRIQRRIDTKYLDCCTDSLDEALNIAKESMKRRNHEEFIVSLWVHIQKSTGGNINKAERDYAYQYESNETVQNKERQQVRDVLKIVSECCVNQDLEGKLLPNEATRFDFCMVVHYLLTNNYKIINKRKFFEWFVSSYTKIKNAVDENGNNIILWKDGRGLNARDYSGTQRSYDGGHRAARLEAFVTEFSQLDEEVIVQKDSKRQFEANIRPLLWLKQDKKCAISDKEIPLEHVMNGGVTHVDHVIPHAKGGLTTVENAQLVFADENLIKSDDIPIGTI